MTYMYLWIENFHLEIQTTLTEVGTAMPSKLLELDCLQLQVEAIYLFRNLWEKCEIHLVSVIFIYDRVNFITSYSTPLIKIHLTQIML